MSLQIPDQGPITTAGPLAGGGGVTGAWTIRDATNRAAPGALLVTVGPEGLVNGAIPTIGGVAINASTPPTLAIPGSCFVSIKVVATSLDLLTPAYTYTIIADPVSSSSDPGTPDIVELTTWTCYAKLGFIEVTSGVMTIAQTRRRDVNVYNYGAANLIFTVS